MLFNTEEKRENTTTNKRNPLLICVCPNSGFLMALKRMSNRGAYIVSKGGCLMHLLVEEDEACFLLRVLYV